MTTGMARNKGFRPEREPFRHTDALQLNHDKIHGPFFFLNPTSAHFHPVQPSKASNASQSSNEAGRSDQEKPNQSDEPASDVEFKWTSRNNRKGRHALVYSPAGDKDAVYRVPMPSNSIRQIGIGVWRMLTYYPIWDVSYLVATVFTLGSVIWVINAFFAFLPFTNPSTQFPGETLYGGGITAFIGATVFELGSVLLMMEAVNENRAGCFGWALEQLYESHAEGEGAGSRLVASKDECTHHHQNSKNFVGQPAKHIRDGLEEKSTYDATTPEGSRSWVWWPSWQELKSHYFHDLGFIACSSQMFGATVFWISGFTALPGIYTALNTTAKIDGAYWVMQIIGGSGFVASGTLFMIETQKHWWLPAPRVLGWHIGLWNLIGGVGFTLCPIFGLYPQHWAQYQASCSTFWGSWAFLIGSAIQWYESLDKHPVEKESAKQ